ncbi:MAG: putative CRISPR-associated protein [bacterium]|jgi:putative CRISPR-associated protein (TIGR02619 family)
MYDYSGSQINTLLCTVGTSIGGYLKAAGIEFAAHRRADILDYLAERNALDKECGAELNSIALIARDASSRRLRDFTELSRIEFLVSDTDNGKLVGDVLAEHVKRNPACISETLKFSTAVHVVRGLVPEDGRRFITEGLASLADIICRRWEEVRSAGMGIAVDATGGFKAQIAVATLLAQVLDMPVLYKYELFNSVERLVPLPVSIDYELWKTHSLGLETLASDSMLAFDEIPDWLAAIRKQMGPLVDVAKVEGKHCASLTITGGVFHRAMKQRFGLEVSLPPDRTGEAVVIWEDGSYGKGRHPEADKMINRLLAKCRYITRVVVYYRHPEGEFKSHAKISSVKKGGKGVSGVVLFLSGGGKTSKAILSFTRDDLINAELEAICRDINGKLR